VPLTLDDLYHPESLRELATGFEFTEGPVWHPDGYWLFVDIRRSHIYRLDQPGSARVIREYTGGGNGMTLDINGCLIQVESEHRRLTRTLADGQVVTAADRWDGKRLNRPNDVVGHSDGRLFFTDLSNRMEDADKEIPFHGVFQIAPDGAVGVVTRELPAPNGLGFSPDEKTLYVANSRPGFLAALDVHDDGTFGEARTFAEMRGSGKVLGVPDGLKVDVEGIIYVAGPGGVWVFEPNGRHVGTMTFPQNPANLAWGEPDRKTLLLTARTSVYTVRMKNAGTAIPLGDRAA
jgi:gluconolactonase